MKRILLAGVTAGVVMFIWAFIAHMFLPIGSMGFTAPPNEAAAIAATAAARPYRYCWSTDSLIMPT